MNWSIYILASPAQQRNPIYSSWIDSCDYPVRFISPSLDWQPPENCALVVSHMHFRWEYNCVLSRVYQENKIPVLVLSDGILEFRNIWENNEVPPEAFYKPVFGHKIACIGYSQARHIDFYGNAGKCEVVGLPRLDPYLSGKKRNEVKDRKTILIASANTPFFNQVQKKILFRSFRDLHNVTRTTRVYNDIPISYRWRVHKRLKRILQLTDNELAEDNLLDELLSSDAVITTPSTLFIEAGLVDNPIALLNYFKTPNYVPPAWEIRSRKEISDVLVEILDPPPAKMMFQKEVLQDSYQLAEPSLPRLLLLIDELIKIRIDCRSKKQTLNIPEKILPSARISHEMPGKKLTDDQEYVSQIESQLAMLEMRLGQMPDEIRRLRAANDRLKIKLSQMNKGKNN